MTKLEAQSELRRPDPQQLEAIPNVGKAIAADLRLIGVAVPADLASADPYVLYDRVSAAKGVRQDPCLLDVFISAVRFMEGGPPLPWWAFTAERKQALSERASAGS